VRRRLERFLRRLAPPLLLLPKLPWLLLTVLLLQLPPHLSLTLLLLFLLLLLDGVKPGRPGRPSRDERSLGLLVYRTGILEVPSPPDPSLMVMGSLSTPDRGGSGAPSCPRG